MIINVDRYKSTDRATLSKVYLDGVFQCYGLEDEHREEKLAGETRIPAGNYKVTLRKEGGHHQKYLARFGAAFHKGMLWVRNVPNFEFILIHIGNTEADTAGCLLVGADRNEDAMTISGSVAAYKKLYPKVVNAAGEGTLRIQYEDNDL